MRDWLAHRADATPTAPAVHGVDGTATSFAALDDRVEEVAARLAGLGVGVGDHVGVVCEARPGFVDLVHATMRVGAVLVPLNARLTRAELAERVDRADLSILVADATTAERATTACDGTDVPVVTLDDDVDARDLLRVDPETYDVPAMTPNDVQTMLFTSGTTGTPKAVALTATNLAVSAGASAFRLGVLPGDRWYDPLPMYHMGGLAPVYRSVLYGTSVVVEGGSDGFDPDRTVEAMHETAATCVSFVPTMLRRIFDAHDGDPFPDSLRFVLLGGAKAPRSLLQECVARDVPVAPTYGMTETSSQIATATPQEARESLGTVGNPLVFTDVTVVDEDERPVSTGETGEIVVSGPTVTAGYYGDVASTRASFCNHGFRTGDVGYRDERGRLFVLNRADDRIVSGGENVDPGEVLDVLRNNPLVDDAAVMGLPDEEWGERVAALVVGDVSEDELLEFLDDRLAGFKKPKTVVFVDTLPRTASGTVDREAARELLERAPASDD
jgi:O-succinylbenzoic acid--CoA ligase